MYYFHLSNDEGWLPLSAELYKKYQAENARAEAAWEKPVHQLRVYDDTPVDPADEARKSIPAPPLELGILNGLNIRDRIAELKAEARVRFNLVPLITKGDETMLKSIVADLTRLDEGRSLSPPPNEYIESEEALGSIKAKLDATDWPHSMVTPKPHRLSTDKDPLELSTDFTARYKDRMGESPEQLAQAEEQNRKSFLEFFDLAGKLNETANKFGIKTAHLDADNGEVTVVFRTRELGSASAL